MNEVAENIYCFPVPLPGSPLKILNCYVIKGTEKNLLIDVGFNTKEGLDAVTEAFRQLSLSLADTDVFLTHLHADHTGLIEVIKKDCARIFISEIDSVHVNRNAEDEYWHECMSVQCHMGFPPEEALHYTDHPAYIGGASTYTDFILVPEGMRFNYGGYNFEALDLKGHTPGQLGLYEKQKSILFCGDHILNKITPNINLWDFKADYLGLFLENLKKVRELDIKTLFSAHRALVEDASARIDGLLAHHDRRLNNVLNLLASGKSTVYEVAMDIPWDYGGGYFGAFPPQQMWFAASEVFAHLEHLRALGKVNYTVDTVNGETYHYYVLNPDHPACQRQIIS
jgi:glyoxylase-like metal-dependent hydrolase (beta-lactamase superfamily II)